MDVLVTSNSKVQIYGHQPSKWTKVQLTVHVTSIWTIQMDNGPMDRLCYVNLDGPKILLLTVVLDCLILWLGPVTFDH